MQLTMKGNIISSPSLFHKHFSPTELLILKEEAAHFMFNIMGPLSPENYFNAVVFLVNTYEPDVAELNADNYKNYPHSLDAIKRRENDIFEKVKIGCMSKWLQEPKYNFDEEFEKLKKQSKLSSVRHKEYLENWFKSRRTNDILQGIYGLVGNTPLTDIKEKNQLFALLASAYLIADKTLEECQLSPEAAHAAFKQIKLPRLAVTDEHKEQTSEQKPDKSADETAVRTEEKAPDVPSAPLEDSKFTVFSERENKIKGRPAAYKLKLRSSFKLKEGETVEMRKIIADISYFGTPVPVKLHIYDSEGKEKVDEIEIPANDYIFANYVGDELVYIHPFAAETERCRVERKGKCIMLTDKETGKTESESYDGEIVAAVPEQLNCGYIGINKSGAFFKNYSLVNLLENTAYAGKDIVQVICTDRIYMLHSSGYVFNNMELDYLCADLYSDLRKYLEERQG